MYEHGYGKEINKDGRHVGLDFYDLLIETIMKSILSGVPTSANVVSTGMGGVGSADRIH
jgi:hypothetical protein